MKSYELTENTTHLVIGNVPAGTVVYDYTGDDYGCACEDTFYRGEVYQAVTADPGGGTPFFTVPAKLLRERK